MLRVYKAKRSSEVIRCVRLTKTAIRATKASQDCVLRDVCSRIDSAVKRSSDGRIPYGFVSKMVSEMRLMFPWIDRDRIMNAYRKQKKQSTLENEPCIPKVPATTLASLRKSGGHSRGETEDSKLKLAHAQIAAMNKLTQLYTDTLKRFK